MDFEINLSNRAVFSTRPKSQRKELLSRNKKHFSLFLKGFQLSKIVSDLRVRL